MDEQTEKPPEVKTDAQVINVASAEQLSGQSLNNTDVEQNNVCDAINSNTAQYLHCSPLQACRRLKGGVAEREISTHHQIFVPFSG